MLFGFYGYINQKVYKQHEKQGETEVFYFFPQRMLKFPVVSSKLLFYKKIVLDIHAQVCK